MKRGTAFWRELFLNRLSSEPTIVVRDVVVGVLGRQPTDSEKATARKASHYLADAGQAVLMNLYPHQVRGEDYGKRGERRMSCLTTDEALVRRAPFCVERSATQKPGWWKDRESEAFKQAHATAGPQLEEAERTLARLFR